MSTPRLCNDLARAPRPPVRLVHLGLGAFHRAHQVWYTQKANEQCAKQWGYASFTGRSPRTADLLTPQDGLYTLVERSAEGDRCELMSSLVEARAAAEGERLVELLSDPGVAVLTLTVTEAGYHLTAHGELDLSDADIRHDLEALRSHAVSDPVPELRSAAGRIVAGLRARRAAGHGGIAVMSCDNIASNGATTRASVIGFARELDADLAAWIEAEVSFPSTSIDRITPAAEPELSDAVASDCHWVDEAPVVTEPFASWVIEGEFPAGRPEWERAGAQFVEDVAPFERRKLWLLNGAHSLIAYLGQLHGHATVAEAAVNPEVMARVNDLWDEAAAHLTEPGLGIPEYREALVERFQNPRIRHLLQQIGTDGATKQQMRAVPIVQAERAAGRSGCGASYSLAAWAAFLLAGGEIRDAKVEQLRAALASENPLHSLVALLSPELAEDTDFLAQLTAQVTEIHQSPRTGSPTRGED